jgi:hypothetical protein
MPTRDISIEVGPRTLRVSVKVADDDEQRAAGFQCATRADVEGTKILFDFGAEITTAFHMQNVAAPLDIAFAKGDGRIFSVQRMVPNQTALHQPMGPFRYALETRAGFFEQQGIRAGEARLALAGRRSSLRGQKWSPPSAARAPPPSAPGRQYGGIAARLACSQRRASAGPLIVSAARERTSERRPSPRALR